MVVFDQLVLSIEGDQIGVNEVWANPTKQDLMELEMIEKLIQGLPRV